MKVIHLKKQHGVALFIVLILLVILTTLSLSAMRGAITATKISGNYQHRQLTFQTAENLHETLLALPPSEVDRPVGSQGSIRYSVITIEGDNKTANKLNITGSLDLMLLKENGPVMIPGYALGSSGITYQADAYSQVDGSGARAHTRMDMVLPTGT